MNLFHYLSCLSIVVVYSVVHITKQTKSEDVIVCLDYSVDCPGCTLKTEFGSEATHDYITKSIFAVWWDKKFDHKSEANSLVNKFIAVRKDCLCNLGMGDPPNPSAGHYYNVYIHHGGNDNATNWPSHKWGNGQGNTEMPYMTMRHNGYDDGTIRHEGLHICQTSHTSPNFNYDGDSMWYWEASASWYGFMGSYNISDVDLHTWGPVIEMGATIVANPQLALWHSFSNGAPDDPATAFMISTHPGWLYGGRQYAMATLLYYLTNVEGVDSSLITKGFYDNTDLSPQEYLYTNVGSTQMRRFFANWAARNCANMDYLTRKQWQLAQSFLNVPGRLETGLYRPAVWEGKDQGTGGQWIRPPPELTARGWAYNVFNITNTQEAIYSFELLGDEKGILDGNSVAPAHFEGRIVVFGGVETRVLDMEMSSSLSGAGSVTVSSSDQQVMMVVAAVPEFFETSQTYGYQVKITRS